MKRFRDLSFRTKTLVVNLSIVLAVAVGITTMLTSISTKQAISSHSASLNLLTEQALINFSNKADSIRQHLYAMSVSTNAPQQMATMRTLDLKSNAYWAHKYDLIQSLSQMVDSSAPYDHVSVKLDDGECVSANSYDKAVTTCAEALLSDARYSANAYGSNTWVRTDDGDLYLIRDVYATQPLRHVGRIAARIRQKPLVSLGHSNQTLHCSLVFFDKHGTLITSSGESDSETLAAAAETLEQPDPFTRTQDGAFAVCHYTLGDWQAVGLLPMSVVNEVKFSFIRSGLLIASLGVLFGLIVTIAFSQSLSRQISRLVRSMNCVAAGDWNVVAPVESQDDIGVLTRHFNDMTQQIRELLARVVQEETSKQQAEYQTLEYEYRFLQWQINPHFIYNALETVNGLAKLDGNDELCEMIVLLSAYFRQNAETMRQRFVTVRREFRSLRQYVEIYRHIYGDTFEVTFGIGDGASDAYLPTMMIQPLLENALIHGVGGAEHNHIGITADVRDARLCIRIRDDGSGMTQETIERILTPPAEAAQTHSDRTSLGVRNVLDRMHLIYGDAASMQITSQPDEGTCVEMCLPLNTTGALSLSPQA